MEPIIIQRKYIKNSDLPFKTQESFKKYLLVKKGYYCEWCGTKFNKLVKRDYVLDHIIPICLGGPQYEESNCQLLCRGCNIIKTRLDHSIISFFKNIGGLERDWDRWLCYIPLEDIRLYYSTCLGLIRKVEHNKKRSEYGQHNNKEGLPTFREKN